MIDYHADFVIDWRHCGDGGCGEHSVRGVPEQLDQEVGDANHGYDLEYGASLISSIALSGTWWRHSDRMASHR